MRRHIFEEAPHLLMRSALCAIAGRMATVGKADRITVVGIPKVGKLTGQLVKCATSKFVRTRQSLPRAVSRDKRSRAQPHSRKDEFF